MQSADGEFVCTECNSSFECASALLKHFAVHVSREAFGPTIKKSDIRLPDLYPISSLKARKNPCKEENADSGYEDINPIKFCMVTLEERGNLKDTPAAEETNNVKNTLRKYRASSQNFSFADISSSFITEEFLQDHCC